MSKTVTDAIKDRRSVRKYKDVEIDTSLVQKINNSEMENTRNRSGFYLNEKNNFNYWCE